MHWKVFAVTNLEINQSVPVNPSPWKSVSLHATTIMGAKRLNTAEVGAALQDRMYFVGEMTGLHAKVVPVRSHREVERAMFCVF